MPCEYALTDAYKLINILWSDRFSMWRKENLITVRVGGTIIFLEGLFAYVILLNLHT